jgi:signal peptidase II
VTNEDGKPTLSDYVLLFGIAGAVLVLDQVTKWLVEANIALGAIVPIADFIYPYLTLTRTQNTGAAFSIFQNGNLFFIVVALIVSAMIVYYAPRLPKSDWLSRVALGLQLGGALGNLVDRLRQGYVTDFIYIQVPQIGFHWPVSNLADPAIVGGVILLLVASLLRDRRSRPEPEEPPAANESAPE